MPSVRLLEIKLDCWEMWELGQIPGVCAKRPTKGVTSGRKGLKGEKQ